jgi:hypothetical protein
VKIKMCFVALIVVTISACASKNNIASGGNNSTSKQPGSYATKQLINDVMLDIQSTLSSKYNCTQITHTQPFVVEHPSGESGSKGWAEEWIVEACGQKHPFLIVFRQSSMGGVNYTVLSKQ